MGARIETECSFPECGRVERARGLCNGHYGQWYRGSELHPLGPPRIPGQNDRDRPCDFDDCTYTAVTRGLCKGHYGQLSRGEEVRPLAFRTDRRTPLTDRLAAGIREEPCGCVVWVGGKTPEGYGVINYDMARLFAHRVSFEISVGPIEEGAVINHLCGNPPCVNPEHLEAVTQLQNSQYKAKVRSSTGVRGVSLTEGGRFRAQARTLSDYRNFGSFDTLEEAEAAVVAGRAEMGFHAPEPPCKH